MTIFCHKGVDKALRWSDDFSFFHFPLVCSSTSPLFPLFSPTPLQPSSTPNTWTYAFDESLIFNVAKELSWLWALNKHILFTFIFPYLGFEWDLTNKMVAIPQKKCAKYLACIELWVAGASASLKDCQSVLGCLQHCTLILSDGCSHLPLLYHLCSSFKDLSNTFIKHHISPACLEDIAWWRSTLSSEWCGTHISVPPNPLLNSIFVDASTSFGIGLILDGSWLAWKLSEGWRLGDCNISWAEMVAIDLGLCTLIHSGFRDCHLIFHSDNQGMVSALKSGCSCNSAQNFILHHIISNFRDHNIWLSLEWVNSSNNLSDDVSQGIFLPSARYTHPPPLPAYLKSLVTLA